MDLFATLTLALTIIAAATVVLIWLKGPLGMHPRFAALEARITELDRIARMSSEGILHARDAKEATVRLEAAVGVTQGRLAGLLEHQQQLGTFVSTLQTTVPLQVSEGLRAINDVVATEHLKLRHETSEHGDLNARAIAARLDSGMSVLAEAIGQLRIETAVTLKGSGEALSAKVEEMRTTMDSKLAEIVTRTMESARSLNETAQNTASAVTDRLAELKATVDAALREELGAIRTENSAKLDAIRLTVDEKLHATLEQRLGESFKLVSERLELVHRGLGEMQTLAIGVGDLKKVLTNVKTRGTWGEVQLEALLEQILTSEQYGRNIETRPRSNARVEFAIRLPGRGDAECVWLPIDAKFPLEDYQRLGEAQERADLGAIEQAGRALESRIKCEARRIRERYIEPPFTTDFAILYLPTEGLYAEVLRRAGVADFCQREYKVSLAGPTTLGAMLNSLQMGFRTLAIERRSAEVWTVLATVKSEFMHFGEALVHTKKKLEEAHNSIESTERRNRVLTRKLKDVDVLPPQNEAETLAAVTIPLAVGGSPADA